MSKKKPKCKLIGENGNAFAIIGKVVRTLNNTDRKNEAIEFQQKYVKCKSYSKLLTLVDEYVEII